MPEFVHISPYPASLSLMQIADRRRSRASLGHCVTRFAPALPHSPQTQLGVENREGWSMRAVTNFGARARTSRGVALFAITQTTQTTLYRNVKETWTNMGIGDQSHSFSKYGIGHFANPNIIIIESSKPFPA